MSFSEKMTAICDAIRSKTGYTAKMNYDTIVEQLNSITSVYNFIWKDYQPNYCEPKALEVVRVAESYWIARAQGRKFFYKNGITFLRKTTNPVNDSNGAAIIDCSTFIHLVLRGISYELSPYSNTTPNLNFDYRNLTTNTKYTWADDRLNNCVSISNNRVQYAADMAAYYYMQGRLFNDVSKVKPGDLLFCTSSINGRFLNVTHVGIISEDPKYYYEVTIDDLVVCRRAVASKSNVTLFARPDYERLENKTYTFDKNFDYLTTITWFDGTHKTNNGVSFDVINTSIKSSGQGSTDAGSEYYIVSSSFPIDLRPGTYKLSGAPARKDKGSVYTNRYWGIAIYPQDGRTVTNKITGFNDTSSFDDGNLVTKEVSTNTIWDIGYGTEFTISSIMRFYCKIWISNNLEDSGYSGEHTWNPSLKRIQ